MESLQAVVETPKGSTQKYDYDQQLQYFRLKKMLPSGMLFPYDFGFIPGTKGEDGDPLDVIIISEYGSFPGCRIKCRLIGGFKAEQSEKTGKRKKIRNDRFFVIPKCSQMFKEVLSLKDLPGEVVKQLEDFFVNYNNIEDRTFKVLAPLERKEAEKIIAQNNPKAGR